MAGKTFFRFHPALRDDEMWMLSQIPEDMLQDAIDNPEQYAWYYLDLAFEKDMPWGVCDMYVRPKDESEGDTSYRIYAMSQGDGDPYWGPEDTLENMKGFLHGTGLLMKVEGDTDEEIRERMRNLELVVEFSTEFAGELYWDDDVKAGYPGMRFTVDIDMSQIEMNTGEDMEDYFWILPRLQED